MTNEAKVGDVVHDPALLRAGMQFTTAVAAAKAEVWKRAIGWVDYYLVMPLEPGVRGALEVLHKRMACEAEHGPSKSALMDSDTKPGAL